MILRLSHADLAVDDLAAAETFYVDVLGLRIAHRSDDALHLRAAEEYDAWSLKLSSGAAGLRTFGFRVAAEADLDALASRHEALGAATTELPAGHEPGRGRTLRVRTPDGFAVDFTHAIDEVPLYDDGGRPRHPQRDTDRQHGVPPARLHHINLRTGDVDASLGYWRDELDFSVSEHVTGPDGETRLAWARRSHSTHDVALGLADGPGMHHLAFTVSDPAHLLRAGDVLADGGFASSVEFGPGRHGVSDAMAMYVLDPSGHRIELFAGDYVRDHDRPPLAWTWDDYVAHGRLWWGPSPPASFVEHATPMAAPTAAEAAR